MPYGRQAVEIDIFLRFEGGVPIFAGDMPLQSPTPTKDTARSRCGIIIDKTETITLQRFLDENHLSVIAFRCAVWRSGGGEELTLGETSPMSCIIVAMHFDECFDREAAI